MYVRLIAFSLSYKTFPDMLCSLLSNVSVTTSFYQSLQALSLFIFAKLILPYQMFFLRASRFEKAFDYHTRIQVKSKNHMNMMFMWFRLGEACSLDADLNASILPGKKKKV